MKLGLGTVQFGLPYGISNKTGRVAPDEVSRILQLAATSSMQVLDTAAGYGNSEAALGASLGTEHGFAIVTKTLPLRTAEVSIEGVARVEAAFEDSLRHLGQPSVYGLLVHDCADLLNPGGERLYASLRRWQDEGRVQKIGISFYTKEEADRLFDKYTFDLAQLPLSVFDQRLVQDGTLQRLHKAGVEVHVRSALLQGLLLMPSEALPPYLAKLKPQHAAYVAALTAAGVSQLAAALGYFHHRPEVSAVLVGVETAAQLKECLAAAKDVPPLDFSKFAVEHQLLDPRAWVEFV
jgi:aryl-alcohol dehydrogenase-like predicted oxidoreductase